MNLSMNNNACTLISSMLTPANAQPHSNGCLSLVFAWVIHRLRGQALTSQDCNSYRLLGISSLLVAGSLDSSSPLSSSSHPSYSSFSSISIFSCRDLRITAIPHHHNHTYTYLLQHPLHSPSCLEWRWLLLSRVWPQVGTLHFTARCSIPFVPLYNQVSYPFTCSSYLRLSRWK